MTPQNNALWQLTILLGIVVATGLCYYPVYQHQFVYDTLGFVWENPYIKEFSWSNFTWILANSYRENWQPITWLSHTLDFELFGYEPAGHHIVNVLFHIIASILLYFVISNLAGRTTMNASRIVILSGLSALLFAIHPLHVESVAMVFERKDVLYTCFTLLCCLSYFRYRDATPTSRARKLYYCTSLLLFALALMTKPMAVTLPAVLLLLDLYPLQVPAKPLSVRVLFQLLKDKMPFFVLILPVIAITLSTQSTGMVPADLYTPVHRILNILHNLEFYTLKFFSPLQLSPFYPFPDLSIMLQVSYWLPGLLLVVLTTGLGIGLWRRQQRALLTGWLYFLVTLAPVSGFIHLGMSVRADHYAYMAIIAHCLLLSWLVVFLIDRFAAIKRMIVVGVAAYVLFLALLAHQQVTHWRSPLSLWTYALAIYPDAILPRQNLALTYILIGEFDIARQHLSLIPDHSGELLEILRQEEEKLGLE